MRSRHFATDLPLSLSGLPFTTGGMPWSTASSSVVIGRCQVPSSAMITQYSPGLSCASARGSATTQTPLSTCIDPVIVLAASHHDITPYAPLRAGRLSRGSATACAPVWISVSPVIQPAGLSQLRTRYWLLNLEARLCVSGTRGSATAIAPDDGAGELVTVPAGWSQATTLSQLPNGSRS